MDIQDFPLEDWGPRLGKFVLKSLGWQKQSSLSYRVLFESSSLLLVTPTITCPKYISMSEVTLCYSGHCVCH